MNPLRFDAPNMREALDQVRTRLGSDAVIVESRMREGNGASGGVTVLALPGPGARPDRTPSRPQQAPPFDSLSDLRADVQTCRSMLEALLADRVYAATSDCDPEARARLAASIPLSGGIAFDHAPAVAAVVGPTGGGKTTTVARLAIAVGAADGRQVQVITGDTHRAHAAEALQACCGIIGSRVEIASAPEDIAAAIARADGTHAILLDTPGISPRDHAAMAELGEWLIAAQPTEVHLVLPATASRTALEAATNAFGRLLADRVILSKVDEPGDLADALAAVIASGKPVSYITEAPGAVDGLRVADSELLARLLAPDDWEERNHGR